MMKNYHLKSRRRQTIYRRPTAIVILFLLVVGGLTFLFPRLFPQLSHSLGTPFWKAKEVTGQYLQAPLSYFKTKSSLERENDRLESRVQELEARVAITALLLDENNALKKILQRAENRVRTLARVIVRPPQSPFGTFIVDTPVDQGKQVVAGDAVLLGESVERLEDSSIVRLYSGSDNVLDVVLASGVFAEAQGRGSGNFVLEVPKETEVAVGEYIKTTTESDYVLGVVEEIEDNETSTFKRVLFRAPLNLHSIEWVEVIES